MAEQDPDEAERQLARFVDRFTPEVAARAHALIAAMRARLPGANALVYDNYNALAVGFGGSERASDIVCSIAVYPRWVSLFLVGGPALDDPKGLLKGEGTSVRHIVLTAPDALADPDIEALLAQAVARAKRPIDPAATGRVIIKSISAKQRPRRPGS